VKNKKYIYIGGGFDPINLSILIPILEGYKNKEEIIVESSEFKIFQDYIKKNKIKFNNLNFLNITLTDSSKIKLNNYIFFLYDLVKNFFFYLKLLLFFSYKDKRNYKSFFAHAYWDSSIRNINDDELRPNIITKLKKLFTLIYYGIYIKELINKYPIKSVFLAHSVYKYRIALEEFKKRNIKVFSQANFVYLQQRKRKDLEWTFVNTNLLKKIKKNISDFTISRFWNLRSFGKLEDIDFLAASKIKSNIKCNPQNNIIFLHVFKDSPFARIDKNRIFFDYYHWIIETIKIIKDSDEIWSLRIHPNSKVWGENSITVLKSIEKKYFKGSFPKNIRIDNKYHSNLKVLSEMKRCVTFSGTSSIEASCYGIKPILISDNLLSDINKNYFLKPKNIEQYREFLLKKNSDPIFIQKKNAVKVSKFFLYLFYNVLSFKNSLSKPKKSINIFSNTQIKEKYKIFLYLMKKLENNSLNKKFYLLGKYLKEKNSRTLDLKFINLLKK
jgi:hypothetical protein